MSLLNTTAIRKLAFVTAYVVGFCGCQVSLPIPAGPQPPAPKGLSTTVGNGTMVFYQTTEGPTIMICSDIVPSSSGSSGSSGGPPWINKTEGFASAQDGRKLSWSLEQRGGQKMKCLLNEKEFDLEKGRLFLVKTSTTETTIEQLDQDLTGATPDAQNLKVFAAKNPTIGKFLGVAEE
jgi:hypothetical protein